MGIRDRFAVEELQPERNGSLYGEDIDDSPPAGKLLAGMDLRDLFQPGRQKRFPELVRVVLGTYFQQLEGGSKFIRDRSGVGECLSRSDTEHRCSGSLGDMKFLEAGEALSVPGGISQFGFEIFQGRVRERNRLQTPASQFDRESLPVPGRASE